MKSTLTNKTSLLFWSRMMQENPIPHLIVFVILMSTTMIVTGVVPFVLLGSFLIIYISIANTQNEKRMQVSLAFILIVVGILFSSIFDQNLWFTFWTFFGLNILYLFYRAKQNHYRKHLIQSIQNSNLIVCFIFIIVSLSKKLHPIDLWAWQFRGDGINFIVSTRAISSTQTLFEGTFLSSSITGITLGFPYLFQFISQGLINLTNSDNGSLAIVGEAFIGVQIFALGALAMSLLSLSQNVKFAAKLLGLMTMTFLTLGPLVGGLTLSNGFLSVPLTITLIVLILANIKEISGDVYRFPYFAIQVALLVLLVSVWSLLAILIASLFALSLFFKSTSRLSPEGSQRIIGSRFATHLCASLIFPLCAYLVFQYIFSLSYVNGNIVRSGGFPQIPLSQYLFFAVFLVLIVVVTSGQPGPRMTSYFSVSLMFFVALFRVHEKSLGSEKILSDLSSNWVTSIYYLQKAFWIFVASVILFLLITNIKNGIFVSGIFLLSTLIPSEPAALWNLEARSLTPYFGIESVLSNTPDERVMYYEFSTWPADAYLNSLSGLQFESYTGHDLGGQFYKSSFYMPKESFSSRSYYTTEQNALCVGQSLIGPNGTIITSNPLLEGKLISFCGKGPFPRVVIKEK